MKARKIFLFLVSVFSFSALALPAFASEGHGLPWGNFLLRLLNLAIFLGIIYYFAGAKIKNALSSRGEKVVQGMNELELKKKEALARLAEVEQHIANVEAECAQLIADGKAQAEQMAASIVAEAEKQAEALVSQAHKTVEQAVKAEIELIRAKVAAEVVAEVRSSLEKNLDNAKHQELIDVSLQKVTRL